ncbi:MAG: PilZ domain-containing protein [Hydrogenophilus sp.]|nr:PilZ domain-containing protein [Hydrogenophilus sp.]
MVAPLLPLTPPPANAPERRRYPRFYVALLTPGRFHLILPNLSPTPLHDLSLIGFSFTATNLPPLPDSFDFSLTATADPTPIAGRAQIRSRRPDGRIGCEITQILPPDRARLLSWLIDYIRANARIPLTQAQAESILLGSSHSF